MFRLSICPNGGYFWYTSIAKVQIAVMDNEKDIVAFVSTHLYKTKVSLLIR